MPKVTMSADGSPTASGPLGTPPVLKRNQACHQCRRRKLKCDAKRPCATCVRSHRNALKHAPPGVDIPPLECTFDDPPDDAPSAVLPAPRTRLEKLENRISELEGLLREKEQALQDASNGTGAHLHVNGNASFNGAAGSSSLSLATDATALLGQAPGLQMANMQVSPYPQAHISPVQSPFEAASHSFQPSPNPDTYSTDVVWSSWPKDLPPIQLLHHLVEVFFSFHPHANVIFHRPTFLVAMTLPPTHNGFPLLAVLHSICSVASFYTAAVPAYNIPSFDYAPADDVFQTVYKRRYAIEDSFGERQAKLAWNALEESTAVGDRLFEVQQATTILAWFYYSHARWAEMYLIVGRAMRYTAPIGLNMCPPFLSISKSLRAPSIIAPARTVIEDETRRNTFWLTYATERYYSSGNGWALAMDDQDISQLLPVRRDQFEQGVLVPPRDRQWAHSPDVLLNHIPAQTDSFVLYVKASMLIGRVKCFNLRFRSKNFIGDPTMTIPGSPLNVESSAQYIDPRQSEGFREIDDLVSAFPASFPRNLRDPVTGGIVDIHLLSACLAPNVCKILLHDPHAKVKRKGCVSALKILEAARNSLDYLYALLSTSYDITLLDNFCCFAFFLTGRVLIRFVHGAKEAGDEAQLLAYRTELEFIRIAEARIGQRLPLAYRYARMLDEVILQTMGSLDDFTLPNFNNINPVSITLASEFLLPVFPPEELAQNSLELLFGADPATPSGMTTMGMIPAQ